MAKGAGVDLSVSMPMPMPVLMNLDEPVQLINLDEIDLVNLDDANLDLENLRFSFKKAFKKVAKPFAASQRAVASAVRTGLTMG